MKYSDYCTMSRLYVLYYYDKLMQMPYIVLMF